MTSTLGNLGFPGLIAEDRQNTSVESPFNIPSMSPEGAALNTGSPIAAGNLGLFEWFGSEEKEQEGEQPHDQAVKPVTPNYTGFIIAGGALLLTIFLIFGKGGDG